MNDTDELLAILRTAEEKTINVRIGDNMYHCWGDVETSGFTLIKGDVIISDTIMNLEGQRLWITGNVTISGCNLNNIQITGGGRGVSLIGNVARTN